MQSILGTRNLHQPFFFPFQILLHESVILVLFCKDKDLLIFNVHLTLNKLLPVNYNNLNQQASSCQ